MAIITFTSDFGWKDHYIASVKARIFNFNPNVKVVDISHAIEPHNIAHAAFVLNAVFRDFPRGTVHLVAVNTQDFLQNKLVAVKVEEHFFLGADNGLVSLVSQKQAVAVELVYDKENIGSFPERNILANSAVALASGASIYDQGTVVQEGLVQKAFSDTKITKTQIIGKVIYIDSYGNAITNVAKKVFEEMQQQRKYNVLFGKESIGKIYDSYSRKTLGDCIPLFNSLNYLEIAIINGSAYGLLGLRIDSPVIVEFYE